MQRLEVRRLITYLLTPKSRVLLEKLTGSQPVKKFPAFYGTRRFITAFTSAGHLSLSWASSIQSIPPTSHFLKIILILSSHLRLGLPNGLFPSGFPTKTLYTPLLSPIHATCHTQWRTEGGFGVFKLPPEIPKALQSRAKRNPICENC